MAAVERSRHRKTARPAAIRSTAGFGSTLRVLCRLIIKNYLSLSATVALHGKREPTGILRFLTITGDLKACGNLEPFGTTSTSIGRWGRIWVLLGRVGVKARGVP